MVCAIGAVHAYVANTITIYPASADRYKRRGVDGTYIFVPCCFLITGYIRAAMDTLRGKPAN
jgi:hypothetical protein